MQKILIYVDNGAGPRSIRLLMKSLKEENLSGQYEIKRVDHHSLKDDSWEKETSLLIFPGGRDIPYHDSLKGEINQRILRYVQEGGSYLGLCAGGYFGASKIEFERGCTNEVIAERELGFFPGLARGSVYAPGQFSYDDESGCRAARIRLENHAQLSVYYNGGCEFVDAGQYDNAQVLASYSDLEGEPAAIVQCAVGKGKAILSGVHPEYSARYLEVLDPYIDRILPDLRESEKQQASLFRYLLSRLIMIK